MLIQKILMQLIVENVIVFRDFTAVNVSVKTHTKTAIIIEIPNNCKNTVAARAKCARAPTSKQKVTPRGVSYNQSHAFQRAPGAS